MNSVEAYGFAAWIGTFVVSALFLLWAYLPEAWLHAWGITYYPNKEWALLLPAFLCMTYMMSGVVYVSLNLLSTAPLTSYETLTDRWTRRPPVYDDNDDVASEIKGRKEECEGEGEEERRATPPLRPPPPSVPHFADLDIGMVNCYLHGEGERRKRRGGGREEEMIEGGGGLRGE